MSEKVPLTIELSRVEYEALTKEAERMDMSKVAVMRQALRLYQMINARLFEGKELAFVGPDGVASKTEIFGMGPDCRFKTKKASRP